MAKNMNKLASAKRADRGNCMESKRDSESRQADIEWAFIGVGDDAKLPSTTETARESASPEASLQDCNSEGRTDRSDPRRPDVVACASPSRDEVKDRIIANQNALKHGTYTEAALRQRAEMLLLIQESKELIQSLKEPDG